MVQVWSGTDQVCPSLIVVPFSTRFGTCSAAICQEDLTPPPLPVSSSCSLLSGGTKGAGFNYGKEVDCDTDTRCLYILDSSGQDEQGRPCFVPISWDDETICCHCLSNSLGQTTLSSTSLLLSSWMITLLFLPLGFILTHFPLKKSTLQQWGIKTFANSIESIDVWKNPLN